MTQAQQMNQLAIDELKAQPLCTKIKELIKAVATDGGSYIDVSGMFDFDNDYEMIKAVESFFKYNGYNVESSTHSKIAYRTFAISW